MIAVASAMATEAARGVLVGVVGEGEDPEEVEVEDENASQAAASEDPQYGDADIGPDGLTDAQRAKFVDARKRLAEKERRGALGVVEVQRDADRALFQSVIDGTVADILAPELADDLEAAYTRNQDDAELAALFEQAVTAYQAAMMAATSSLA